MSESWKKREWLVRVLTEQNRITAEFMQAGDYLKAKVSISQAESINDELLALK
jgi:hypothetical protein